MSATKHVNTVAWQLRTELFELTNKFKDLQAMARNGQGDFDAKFEASQQIDTAACALAKVHEALGDVFVDASRDEKDMAYAISI